MHTANEVKHKKYEFRGPIIQKKIWAVKKTPKNYI